MKKIIYLRSEENKMNYEVFFPEGSTSGLPMITFLHGAGERGENVSHLAKHGLPLLIENGAEYPAIILCPQCPANCVWDNVVFDVKEIIDKVAAEYGADVSRLSVTGGSMGGFGTWAMGQAFPNFFSAMAPLAAGGAAWRCRNLINTPIAAYHGEKDEGVLPICGKIMVDAVNEFGGEATFTLLKGYGHNDGINVAYEKYGVVDFLLSKKRTDFSPVPEAFSKYF